MSVSSSRVLRLPFAEGAVFGRYQLLAKLGQGGMADVFLAVARGPEGFNKLVVIKRLKDGVAEDPEVHAMFMDEARLAARLNHPNVVQTYEFGEVDHHYYLAMEYLEGQPLNRLVSRAHKRDGGGKFPLGMALRIVEGALKGLEYAHELTDYDGTPLRMVHRDVSPHNVFVTYDGLVKLVDFGIAKAAVRSAETSTGVVKGKISYMAPEQALSHPIDHRADLFSLGVILWELVTGERFWGHLTEVQILQKMAFGDAPRLRALKTDVPPELDAICAKALAMNSLGRYESAAEFRRDIEALIAKQKPVDSAELGRFVVELFADRRAEIKSLVLEHFGGVAPNNPRAAPRVTIAGGFAAVPAPRSVTRSADDEPLSERHREATPSAATHSSLVRVPTRRSRAPIVLGVSAIAAAVGIVVIAIRTDRTNNGTTTTQASPPSVAATTAPAAAANAVEVRLKATPAEATILIDDVPAAGNPFAAKFPNDGTAHRIRIEAPGYKPYARMVVFDKEPDIAVTLEREALDAGAPAAPAGSRPSSGRGHSGAKVDTTDPWKR